MKKNFALILNCKTMLILSSLFLYFVYQKSYEKHDLKQLKNRLKNSYSLKLLVMKNWSIENPIKSIDFTWQNFYLFFFFKNNFKLIS